MKRLQKNAAASIFQSLFRSVYTDFSYWSFSAVLFKPNQAT